MPTPATAVAASGLLLSVQEADPGPVPVGSRAGALRRGHDLLARLDDLRRALIAGVLAPHGLDDLARALAAERTASDDPKLDALIGEIELRAAVEMAKIRRRRTPAGGHSGPQNGPVSHFLSKA